MEARDSPTGDAGTLAEAVVRTIREPLLILDPDLRVEAANPAFYRTFRTEEEETVGRRLYDLGSGQWDIPRLRDLLEEIIPRDTVVEDFRVEHAFGELGRRVMLVNARRLEGDAAEGERILLAIADVTGEERIREELQRTVRELRRSNEELERFAYVASHDLQEPLRMVSSYTQLLAKRYEEELDERARKYIRYAAGGARRMKALINDLLEYSRVESRGRAFEEVDADEVLDDVLEGLRLALGRTGARVEREPLPTVVADRVQLGQLLQNLIENGLKFSGEEAPRIDVSARRGDGEWIFTVTDRGIGVDEEYEERIFEIFRRVERSGEGEDEGTGIGLALCKRIAERHGGRIWVESGPGEGAAFHFTISDELEAGREM